MAIGSAATDETALAVRPESSSAFQLLWDGLADAMVQLGQLLPRVVAALIVAAVGYVLSRLAAKLVVRLLKKFRVSDATERAGIDKSLRNAGVQQSVVELFASIVFFSLLAVFLSVALHLVGITGVTTAVDQLVAFIPRVLVAAILLVVGLLFATLIRGLIVAAANNSGIRYAEGLATAVYYLLAFLTAITAFEQLQIRFALLNQLIVIAFAAVALGGALSIGLGGREIVSGFAAGFWLRQQIQSGDIVKVDGVEGKVRVIGAMSTIVESEHEGMLRRHSIPNGKMIREAITQ